ncbi:S1 family peptidase [Thalassomonas haliotis]|uniref:Trypsin-like serine protease n=1 Tax=Thalassomonas haliotis TaxID=485448 RepID=A0ABY7VFI0_9GAMM|nr:trypsin-like serine protease [Thalassomonas haliotis]WDE11397.1 trypsin-like serine protease [Thalassomonas haliotis]
MKFTLVLALILLFFSPHSFAVIKRHDIPATAYQVAEPPGYLIDMPHDGHGVLISPSWIVTVAHVIFYDYQGKTIAIGDKSYQVAKVIIHPGYKKPDKSLTQGDAKPLMDFFKSNHDIALVQLTSQVTGITPIKLYSEADERGKTVKVFGRGSTGDGRTGEVKGTKSLKILNRFENKIETLEANWLSLKFDRPPYGLALEGIEGNGDSGGPSVIYKDNIPYLAGLVSWDYWQGDLATFKNGLYGNRSYQVRISSYIKWIRDTINNS